jgi:non-ribosomal peptide synthetase component F
MSGASLIIARPHGHRDPKYLRELIESTGVTTLHFVPSMLQIFLDQYQGGGCSTVRHIVCSGEELTTPLQNKCLGCFPHAHLSNLYGPTEAAIDVTAWRCELNSDGSRVPIGRPISNTRMYVLDGQLQPVAIGVVGEIYIGGVNVGRGYLNRPELTADRFIADPFDAHPRGTGRVTWAGGVLMAQSSIWGATIIR